MKRHKISDLQFESSLLRCFQLCVFLTFVANALAGKKRWSPLATCCVYNPFSFYMPGGQCAFPELCNHTCDNTILAECYCSGDLVGKVQVHNLEFV